MKAFLSLHLMAVQLLIHLCPLFPGLGQNVFVHQSVNCSIIEACGLLIIMLSTVGDVRVFAFGLRLWMRVLALLFIVLTLSSQYDTNQT